MADYWYVIGHKRNPRRVYEVMHENLFDGRSCRADLFESEDLELRYLVRNRVAALRSSLGVIIVPDVTGRLDERGMYELEIAKIFEKEIKYVSGVMGDPAF